MKKIKEVTEQITNVDFSDELTKSYIDYAMSVITARALPDVRDGLKPVQRRILYDMEKLNVTNDKPTKKCARIVGDTMGKYHPHGDGSIYETLVVMSQEFKKRMPLVFGQGNFGSIEGDGAAAQRYTEARLTKFTEDILLKDLDKTVLFQQNYDGTEIEPEVLPAKLPLLLLNGSDGIAVGMATSIPSHNIVELCDLCSAYISNPKMTIKEMLAIMEGPDFSTGGMIANKDDLLQIYETGSGKLRVRGTVKFEKSAGYGDHDKLIITEIPYTMIGLNINRFLNDVAALVTDKTLPEIIDISNQTNKDGIRIVLELRNGSDAERIKNILYKKTKFEDTFGVNMLAIKDNRPEVLSVKSILEIWRSFQHTNLHKKYANLLVQQGNKTELLDGLFKACGMIDLIIEVIRGSKTVTDAKQCLISGNTSPVQFKNKTSEAKAKKLSFTEAQAEAILKMPLQKLIGLELDALKKEYVSSLSLEKKYKGIVSSEQKQNEIIQTELLQFKKEFKQPRKTKITNCEEIILSDKKEPVSCHLLIDKFFYGKLIDETTFERNTESVKSEYPYAEPISSDGTIYIFTDAGNLYQLNAEKIPLCRYREKGLPIESLISLPATEKIIRILSSLSCSEELIFVTFSGICKKVHSSELISNRKIIACTKLREHDNLIYVDRKQDKKYLLLKSHAGYILKFDMKEIPLFKKNSEGIKGILLADDTLDSVSMVNNTDKITIGQEEFIMSKIKTGKRGTKGKLICHTI